MVRVRLGSSVVRAFLVAWSLSGCNRASSTRDLGAKATLQNAPLTASAAPLTSSSGGAVSKTEKTALTAEAFVADACVRSVGGGVWCWDASTHYVPTRIRELDGAANVEQGPVFKYILRTDGRVFTYGVAKNPGGAAIGQDMRTYKDVSTPEPFSPLSNIIAISSYIIGLALRADGVLLSWSEQYDMNDEQEYTGYTRTTPKPLTTLPKAKALSGWYLTDASGYVFVIGFEKDGNTLRPIWVPEVRGATQVAVCDLVESPACALMDNGSVRCWEKANDKITLAPVIPRLPSASRIACYKDTLYSIDRDGELYSWKFLNPEEGSAPMHAFNLHGVQDVQAYADARPNCVIYRSGALGCWSSASRIGRGDWPPWSWAFPKTFSAVTEPIFGGVDLLTMHPVTGTAP